MLFSIVLSGLFSAPTCRDFENMHENYLTLAVGIVEIVRRCDSDKSIQPVCKMARRALNEIDSRQVRLMNLPTAHVIKSCPQ